MVQNEGFKAYEGFSLLAECLAADSVPVKKFKSSRTGLTVIIAEIPGPLVHGSIFVATEAEDDDGLPHTLEHLIFLGSTDFPYKGTLDILANRCLASGTNAWTDVDHTAYTVSTAGSDGFLALLPIYLDHLFFPTLTDAAFVTEVYHITGEGKDSGVVFCEMQGLESSDDYLTYMEFQRAMYKRDCGYRYDTGGAVSNLRYCTNNEKIRKFHKQFYRPLNTTIVVAGSVDEAKLIETCYKFEEKLISRGSSTYEKAWQKPVAPLEKSIVRGVTYPCDQEDNGHVMIGWQGPSVVNEYYHVIASQILFTYLTETGASPLMKYFVETSDPYCSDVSVSVIENSISVISLVFDNVVIQKMPLLHEKLMSVLHAVAGNVDEDVKINHTRMVSVIKKFALKQLLCFEQEPQNIIAMTLIRDTLYGKSVKDMYDKLNLHLVAEKLLAEPISFWLTLLNRYFLSRPSVTVLGYPWKNEQIVRAHYENERVANRQTTLGEQGLKQMAEKLQKATEENKILPPDELIATVSVPRTDNFKFHSISRYTTTSEEQHPDFNITSAPIFTQLDDLDSKFVHAYVVMDTSKLPKTFGLYLPLFLQYISECPINRNGEFISHEQVAAELEQDLVNINCGIGLFNEQRFSCGSYGSTAMISMTMTQENFEKGLGWIRSLLYESVFTSDRLQVIIQKLTNSISQIRRQGSAMVKHLAKLMSFDAENFRTCTVLAQLKFLTDLSAKLLKEEECQKLIRDLELVRTTLTHPGCMILHLSTSVNQLVTKFKQPASYLSQVIPANLIPNQNRMHIPHDYEFLSPAISHSGGKMKSCVVGMATEDSYFMYHATKSITDFYHPDLPALLVFVQYLKQIEGPLWRNIRGFGLAYHYNITLHPNEGVLYLTLFRSTDIVQAFRRTKDIVTESMQTAGNWNHLFFESAKSSLIFEIVDREKNVSAVSRESLLAHFRGTSEDYHRTLIKHIQNVGPEAMKQVGEKYIRPLFDSKTSLSTIVCHNSKYEEVAQGFLQMGFELTAFPSLEDSFMSPSFIIPEL